MCYEIKMFEFKIIVMGNRVVARRSVKPPSGDDTDVCNYKEARTRSAMEGEMRNRKGEAASPTTTTS